MRTNLKAFLDMVATSEIGAELLELTDNGYDVLVGSTPAHILRFTSYADHPNILNEKLNSTAAGRYQTLHRYYDAYKKKLDLPDFSPASQDAIAIEMITECHALADIEVGFLASAIKKCSSRWASLPGAGYGQHENKFDDLKTAYLEAGGSVAT